MRTEPLTLIGLAVSLSTFLLLFVVGPSHADIVLRYSPTDTSVAWGDDTNLSIMIDDTINVRTVEAWVDYDPAILSSIDGHSGLLFEQLVDTTGVLIWEDFDEPEPGHWHGYAVVMGAYNWCTGPGELYVWNLSGDALGTSDVITANVRLFDEEGTLIDNVTLPPTTVQVYNPSSMVPRSVPQALFLRLFPNPFNPRTLINFQLPNPGPARIEVFDSRGRNVGTAWQGWYSGDPQSVPWEGRDDSGRALPSGVYLFRMEGSGGIQKLSRGVLMK